MAFLLMILLPAACIPQWSPPPFGPDPLAAAAATLLIVLLQVFCAALNADRAVLALSRRGDWSIAARHFFIGRNLQFFLNLFGFAAAVSLGGWGWLVQAHCLFTDSLGRTAPVPGAELLILAPFYLALLGCWLVHYDADRAFHDANAFAVLEGRTYWSRAGYAFHQFRQNAIFIFISPLLMTFEQGAARAFPQTLNPAYANLASAGLMPLFLLVLPLLIPVLLGARTLPPGPVRERLHADARRLGLRYRDILLWNTRGAAANAMVVGLVGPARYILFTDRLLQELSPDEVDAVLGHEVGHVRHHHMLFYAAFLVLSVGMLGGIAGIIETDNRAWADSHRELVKLAPFLAIGLYMFAFFGFLSRRCERQADLYGCKAVSCGNPRCTGHDPDVPRGPFANRLCPTGILTFIRALDRVSDLNGLHRDRPRWHHYPRYRKPVWLFEWIICWLGTWQHSTIHLRIRYLESLISDPASEARFQRGLWWIKLLLLAAPATVIAWIGFSRGWSELLGSVVE